MSCGSAQVQAVPVSHHQSCPSAESSSSAWQTSVVAVNDVRLVGRLGARVAVRVLPSGDELVEFSVIVDREPAGRTRKVDTVACQTSLTPVRAEIESLREGAWVEVRGCLRRRFWRGPQGLGSALAVDARTVMRMAPE